MPIKVTPFISPFKKSSKEEDIKIVEYKGKTYKQVVRKHVSK
jgi:hypothetical protein